MKNFEALKDNIWNLLAHNSSCITVVLCFALPLQRIFPSYK